MKVFGLIVTTILSQLFAQPSQRCNAPLRQEWDEQSPDQKTRYIAAIHCLTNAESLNAPQNNQTSHSLYDDFVWWHWNYTPSVHFTPLFFPFHRLYIHAFEQAVIQTCGPQFSDFSLPYWDIRTDSNDIESSSVFLDENFGGNGNSSNENCVDVGSFKGYTNVFPTESCLKRIHRLELISNQFGTEEILKGVFNGSQTGTIQFNAPGVQITDEMERTYDLFRFTVERTVHAGVHFGIGGDMSAAGTAPNDPIFWLHHTNIDRIWYQWQRDDFESLGRTFDGMDENNRTVSLSDQIDMGFLNRFLPIQYANRVTAQDSIDWCYLNYSNSGKIVNGAFVTNSI